MKLLGALLHVLPRFAVYAFALFPVFWYYLKRPEGRASSIALLRQLGSNRGPWGRFWFGLGQARAFSHVILDNMYLGAFGPKKFELKKLGTEAFHKALAKGKGLILLSAHVGNWHLAVNFLWNTNTRVHLVIDDVRQADVRRQMDLAKKSSPHLIIHDPADGQALIFELSAALKRGEVIVLAGDRLAGERRERIPFLGDEAWFPTTAFSISAATGAPICTALSFRTGMQRYACYGLGPFDKEIPREITNRQARVRWMAQTFAAHLETYVRQYPKQWFNFYDFWR